VSLNINIRSYII